ncbi:MAG TPA: aldo/keto reductase [Kineosporiaceae bacterium]|nr:aldo/keto reductase [Kineosporiaceae bacterium]
MSDLALGRLGYGAANIGNLGSVVTDEQAHELLQTAWDGGIRHFDTAPHYGLGLSEQRLGAFLATKPRAEYVLSTKVGRLLEPNPDGADRLDDEGFVVPAQTRRVWDFTEAGIRRSLEESLIRLGIDSVDVIYLHDPERWDLHTALDLGLPVLCRLRDDSLAAAIGVASMDTPALLAAASSGVVDLVMAAGRYTLADQDAAAEVLPACRENGVGVVAAAVFNGGLLAAPPTEQSTFDYRVVPGDVLERARRIEAVCTAHGVPLTAAALQFPLQDDVVCSVVAGGAAPAQIGQNLAHMSVPIPAALWEQLDSEGLVTR